MTTSTSACSVCGFIYNCICDYQPYLQSKAEIALIYHQNEVDKSTNTGKLLLRSLANASYYVWQRKAAPTALIDKIKQPDTEVWLLFPGENSILSRDYLQHRNNNKKQLFILLDATWQEAKKMVNKSPWLADLPRLSLCASAVSHYHLRRNQSQGNLCTCEAGIEVLDMIEEPENAAKISAYYQQFLAVFQAERSGHRETSNDIGSARK